MVWSYLFSKKKLAVYLVGFMFLRREWVESWICIYLQAILVLVNCDLVLSESCMSSTIFRFQGIHQGQDLSLVLGEVLLRDVFYIMQLMQFSNLLYVCRSSLSYPCKVANTSYFPNR